ncbi:MAG: DUF4258 domain-containing protein [Candidatus Electrothrix sp. EH2]|nr:DUF4258 domain-containing protein [Candidatus Electrothrix sp. EH2]
MIKLLDILDDDIEQYRIEYRVHAVRRMFQRDIFEEDIELLLKEGQIIERYDDDFPLPSLLISGSDVAGRPLHVVAGINNAEKIIVVITAYEPDPLKWSDNFTGRIQ